MDYYSVLWISENKMDCSTNGASVMGNLGRKWDKISSLFYTSPKIIQINKALKEKKFKMFKGKSNRMSSCF